MAILSKVLNSNTGSILVSIILGLGISAIFRRACSGKACVVIKAPPVKDTSGFVYRIDNNCYKYTPYVTKC
jgi:hypothetical protein